ncbi:MAG: type II CAAX endopeptidase family protein [Acutalibacteraceae bacterium]|nr:type II CAAX endopeptidase family protein [Acutalibacteraceae bacterium]
MNNNYNYNRTGVQNSYNPPVYNNQIPSNMGNGNFNYSHNNHYNPHTQTPNMGASFTPNCGYGSVNATQQTGYYAPYNPWNSAEEKEKIQKSNERRVLRKTSNRIGGGLMIFAIISELIVFLFMIPLAFTGAVDQSYAVGIEPVTMYILNAILCLIGFGITGIFITKSNSLRMDDVIQIKKTNIADTAKLVIAGMCFTYVFNILLTFMNINLSLFGYENEMSDYGEINGFWGNVIYFIAVAIIPPIIEEFLFRGAILGSLRKKHGDAVAIIVSSVLFGLAHANFVQTPVTFLSGLVMGYLAVKTNSIVTPMILHCVNNSIAVISEILLITVDNEQIYNIIDISIALFFLVIGLLCVISLFKKHKNDLFAFDKQETKLNMSNTLISIFTAPWMIVYIIYSIIMCIYSSIMV